ncbi:glycosyltransferase family 2 protein [Chloroflexia bacterium SDU3-3]|nr:glycosyltransferase family 2 protein [Chloroflexia bacterium SDU3-3]
MGKRIGIFVIAYNAESTLQTVLTRIPAAIVDKVEEIFVIDDCSTDRTYEVGQSYAAGPAAKKLTVHRNAVNQMYGGNQKRGYQYAMERGLDIVVLLHGDGQYAPEVMQALLDPLERGQAEMVMGSRMMIPGAARRGRMPLYKFVGNKILSWTQNFLLGSRFTEFHSGYRAYATSALRSLDFSQMTDSWHFDTQIILNFLRRGYRIVEVPIPTYYGDEICHVNGVPYAFECIKATAAYAWNNRFKPWLALRPTHRSAE